MCGASKNRQTRLATFDGAVDPHDKRSKLNYKDDRQFKMKNPNRRQDERARRLTLY